MVITSENVENVKNFIGTIDETLAKVKRELYDPEIIDNINKLGGIINQLHVDYLKKIQGQPRGEQPKPQAQPPKLQTQPPTEDTDGPDTCGCDYNGGILARALPKTAACMKSKENEKS